MIRREKLFGQQQVRRDRVSDAEIAELYGPLVFDALEPFLVALSEAGVTLESGDFQDIKRDMGEVFAKQVGELRVKLKGMFQDNRDHKGAFDAWFKETVNESYGGSSDFGKKHGDQSTNAICLVLRDQAVKHSAIKVLCDLLGIQMEAETKAWVRPVVEDAKPFIQKRRGELKKGVAPKREDFQTPGEYVRARTRADENRIVELALLEEAGRAIKWLEGWLADDRKFSDAKPGDRNKRDAEALTANPLEVAIAKLEGEIEKLQNEVTATTQRIKTSDFGELIKARMRKALADREGTLGQMRANLGELKAQRDDLLRRASAAPQEEASPVTDVFQPKESVDTTAAKPLRPKRTTDKKGRKGAAPEA